MYLQNKGFIIHVNYRQKYLKNSRNHGVTLISVGVFAVIIQYVVNREGMSSEHEWVKYSVIINVCFTCEGHQTIKKYYMPKSVKFIEIWFLFSFKLKWSFID